jgi:NADPH-dependent ferric siderophore reductase
MHVPVDAAVSGEPGASFATRYYTIRRIDAAAGWVDIDFVLYEAPGPAGDFALSARIGDICGMSGPCGLGIKPAGRYLLAGDETALPAIAGIAERLPSTTAPVRFRPVRRAVVTPSTFNLA